MFLKKSLLIFIFDNDVFEKENLHLDLNLKIFTINKIESNKMIIIVSMNNQSSLKISKYNI